MVPSNTARVLKRFKKDAVEGAKAVDMEATSHVATGKLTGPDNGTRQEQ